MTCMKQTSHVTLAGTRPCMEEGPFTLAGTRPWRRDHSHWPVNHNSIVLSLS